MAKPQNKPPITLNTLSPCFGTYEMLAEIFLTALQASSGAFTVLTSEAQADPTQVQHVGDLGIVDWSGNSYKAWATTTLAVEAYGAGNGNVRIASDTITFTTANISVPVTIKSIAAYTDADSNKVLGLGPLSSPWHVTANGQTMSGKLYWYPRTGFWEFQRAT